MNDLEAGAGNTIKVALGGQIFFISSYVLECSCIYCYSALYGLTFHFFTTLGTGEESRCWVLVVRVFWDCEVGKERILDDVFLGTALKASLATNSFR